MSASVLDASHASSQLLLAMALLALVTFAIGLSVPRASLHIGLAQTRVIGLGSTVQWLLLPLITAALIWLVPVSSSTSQALWLVAATPGGYGLLTFALLARSDLAAAMGLSLASTALKLLLTPVVWWIGTQWLVKPAELPLEDAQIARMVLFALPALLLSLGIGVGLQAQLPHAARVLRHITHAAVLLLLLLGISQAAQQLVIPSDVPSLAIALVVVVHHALACVSAEIIGRLSGVGVGARRSLVFASGTFNASLAVPLALVLFPNDAIALLTLGLWVLWRLLAGSVLALLWRRNSPPEAATPEPAKPLAGALL